MRLGAAKDRKGIGEIAGWSSDNLSNFTYALANFYGLLKSDRTIGAGKFLRLRPSSLCSPEKRQAISYAEGRACFRSGEIRILDSTGNVERVIRFNDKNRRL